MKNLALPRIQRMQSYNPPLSMRRSYDGLLLDFNERGRIPSEKVQKSIQEFLKSKTIQLYPEYDSLDEKIASYVGVSKNQIMTTNGSDQAIDLVFRTFTDGGDTVIIPSPTFPMFAQCAQMVGNKILSPLYTKENVSFPKGEILKMITKFVKLIVICNPNNPTGTLVPISDIEEIAQKAPNAIILVDEAYFEFSKVTAVTLIKKYSNIIVIRTLSKAFGLPAVRAGYVIASEMYIEELLKVRGPYDVNMIASVASSAALDDLDSMQSYVKEIIEDAKPMVEKFFSENNIQFYPSSGNFLLYRPTVEKEAELLKQNGILVRVQDKITIENTIRLTIGTVLQMKQFITVYKNVILHKSKIEKYAFLDRDGTLIFEPQDTFQIDSIDKLKILDGVLVSLKALTEKGYTLVMITNQDGLGTPAFPKKNFETAHNKMLSIFKENGITFQEIFICPHMPSENCNCRKPKTGMVKKFLKKNGVQESNAFMCGDRVTDKQFAENIGVPFITMKTNTNLYNALAKGGIL